MNNPEHEAAKEHAKEASLDIQIRVHDEVYDSFRAGIEYQKNQAGEEEWKRLVEFEQFKSPEPTEGGPMTTELLLTASELLSEEQKEAIVREAIISASQMLLIAWKVCGLKTHIKGNVEDPETHQGYDILFMKSYHSKKESK